ncbi:MAG: type II toxin-antitoxin system mRNA interferase toxin, RelE/StbE family [Patescibacteria group bacterium]
MQIIFHKDFNKKYFKLKESEKKKFKERLNIFIKDPYNPILNNHALSGKYLPRRSINVTGDLRALFKIVDPKDGDTILFTEIDTHSNLYS